MMISLKNKLKSTSGASLVISMMFFLVAMMVGTVCLTAAYNNAGRATHEQDSLQQNYAVESAINLIKQDMARTEYNEEYSAEFILTPLPDDTGKITKYTVEISDDNKVEEEGKFVPRCGKLLYQVLTKNGASLEYEPSIQGTHGNLTLTLNVENSKEVEDSEVNVTFENCLDVTGTYTLGTEAYVNTVDTLDLDLVVSVSYGNNSGMTTVTFPAQVRTHNVYNLKDETVTEKLIVTWDSPRVS